MDFNYRAFKGLCSFILIYSYCRRHDGTCKRVEVLSFWSVPYSPALTEVYVHCADTSILLIITF